MASRYKLSRGKSKRVFSYTASHINSKNVLSGVMRGGYRI